MLALASSAIGCGGLPDATTDFYGSKIQPPCGLEKIQLGMTANKAEELVPALHRPQRQGVRDELVLDSGVADVELAVRLDNGAVSSIVEIVQGHTAREMLTRAWGEPKISRDSLGQPEVTWASEDTGWKVKLDCIERNCLVEFVPYHALANGFLGTHVMPPGDLTKLKLGMKISEARAIASGVVDVSKGITIGTDGVTEHVKRDDHAGVINAIYLSLPPGVESQIEDAWGEPQLADEVPPVKVWLDPATGWRATLRTGLGRAHDLYFEGYVPASQLLGDQPDHIDALPEPVLGQNLDDVKKAYKADFATGPKDATIALLPTEWDSRVQTKVTLDVAGGKVKQLGFSIPYRRHPDARDTLIEMFAKKWGNPKQIEQDGKPVFVYREDDPRVEIRDDTEHGAWHIELKEHGPPPPQPG